MNSKSATQVSQQHADNYFHTNTQWSHEQKFFPMKNILVMLTVIIISMTLLPIYLFISSKLLSWLISTYTTISSTKLKMITLAFDSKIHLFFHVYIMISLKAFFTVDTNWGLTIIVITYTRPCLCVPKTYGKVEAKA